MRVTKWEVKEEHDRSDDPGVYPSGAGGARQKSQDVYSLEGYLEVTTDPKDPKDPDQLDDAVYDFARNEVKGEFGNYNVRFKVKKMGSNKFRLDVIDSDQKTSWQREGKAPKSFSQLIKEVSNV